MISVLVGLYPSWGVFCCWQLFLFLVLLIPSVFFNGSLEGCVLSMNWVVDEWSISLVFLTVWLGGLMALYSNYSGSYSIWGTVVCCVLSFCSFNFLGFYVFFELSVIPVSFLILSWGEAPERLSAVFYFFLYTVVGSSPFLAFICFRVKEDGHLFMGFGESLLGNMGWLSLFVIVGFLVKFPVYPLHLWLTKAHVEAPTVGSMALAGVLLKLGGLGLFRIFSSYGHLSYKVETIVLVLSVWGAVLASFIALSQLDSKALVAYGSVSHMALVLVGILSGSFLGCVAAFFLMVAHGLYSSGLFSLLGDLSSKAGTRCFFLLKGFLMVYPSGMFWWFILCCCSMGCPPSCSFLVEVFMGMIIGEISGILIVLFGFLSFLGGVCGYVLYSGVSHGSVSSVVRPSLGYSQVGLFMGMFHSIFLFFLFLFPGLIF